MTTREEYKLMYRLFRISNKKMIDDATFRLLTQGIGYDAFIGAALSFPVTEISYNWSSWHRKKQFIEARSRAYRAKVQEAA